MRNTIKAALVAFGALGALAGTASAQPYDESYYGYDPGLWRAAGIWRP